jgi:hypothetical protein
MTVHKLMADVDNKITIYLDQGIKNEFMSHAVDDMQALATNGVKTTSSEVRKYFDESHLNHPRELYL